MPNDTSLNPIRIHLPFTHGSALTFLILIQKNT